MKRPDTTILAFTVVLTVSFAYDPVALEKGRRAAHELDDTLNRKLEVSMRETGPVWGVIVCSYQAEALTKDVAENLGVRVKRTSLKLRNPKNAPDDYERSLLSRLAGMQERGMLPVEVMEEVREGEERVFRYAKPLVVTSLCLTCHGKGEEIPPEVREELEIRYPGDAATGYSEGELRGIVSVVIPAE